MDPLPCIPLFILLVIFCAVIEVACKAFAARNQTEAKKLYPEEDSKYKKLIAALEKSNKIIFACETAEMLIISVSCLMMTAEYGKVFIEHGVFKGDSLAFSVISRAIVFLVSYLLFLIFAKGLPSRLAAKYGDRLCISLLPVLRFVTVLFSPVCVIADISSALLARFAGVTRADVAEKVTEEEIRQMVDDSRESGNIEESAKEMIHGIFEFDDRVISEITTHRTDVVAVEENASLEEIMQIVDECGYSRIPVYRETLDDVIGLLYVKDLLKMLCSDSERLSFNLSDYIREAMYIPETASFKEVFEKFKSVRIQMAVVIDEYGGTSGIVTMEDLIESIMGTINDEYDDEEDVQNEQDIVQISDSEFVIEGLTPVKDVEEAVGISFENEENCETIGGLVVSLLGVIPEEDECPELTFDGVCVKVVSVAEHRVEKIHLTLADNESAEEDETEFEQV